MDLNQKALFVNLTEGIIEKKIIPMAVRKKFLGGRGIDAYILLTHVEPGTDPLGPENYLSIGAGILSGTGMPTCGRLHISAKSPLTGLFGSSNMGGDFFTRDEVRGLRAHRGDGQG